MAKTSSDNNDIIVDNNDIIKPEHLQNGSNLIVVELCNNHNIQIGLLIVANCSRALEPEVVMQVRMGVHMNFEQY